MLKFPFFAKLAKEFLLLSKKYIFSAIFSTLLEGIKMPLMPSLIMFGIPPTFVEITTKPDAKASNIVTG